MIHTAQMQYSVNQQPLKLIVHTYSEIIGILGKGLHRNNYIAGIEPVHVADVIEALS